MGTEQYRCNTHKYTASCAWDFCTDDTRCGAPSCYVTASSMSSHISKVLLLMFHQTLPTFYIKLVLRQNSSKAASPVISHSTQSSSPSHSRNSLRLSSNMHDFDVESEFENMSNTKSSGFENICTRTSISGTPFCSGHRIGLWKLCVKSFPWTTL